MERKSDMVRRYVAAGEYKKALSIAKDFKLGISNVELDAMTRAYECMVHPAFYKSLGTDVSLAIHDGITVLNLLYG